MDSAQDPNNPNQPTPQSPQPPPAGSGWRPPEPDWSTPPVTQSSELSMNYTDLATSAPQVPPTVPQSPSQAQPPSGEMSSLYPTGVPPQMSTYPTGSFPPQPPLAPQQIPPQAVPPRRGGVAKIFLLAILILLIIAVGGAIVVVMGKKSQVLIVPPPVTPPEVLPSPSPLSQDHNLLYLKDGNIYRFSSRESSESAVTNDTSQLITYRVPRWITDDSISYIRCERQGQQSSDPYSCALILHKLAENTKTTYVTLQSQPDANGYQMGAELYTYAWGPDKSAIAYLGDKINDDKTVSQELRYSSSVQQPAAVLDHYQQTAGRGGSPNDNVTIKFSPDGKKLLLVNTVLYPQVSGDDRGTMDVYDLPTNLLIWHIPKMWTTFGYWLPDGKIIAKQQLQSSTDNEPRPWNLIRINLSEPNADPSATTEVLAEVPEWYGIEPLSQNALIYWELKKTVGGGLTLDQYDLAAQQKQPLKENLLKVLAIDDRLLVVRTLVPCAQAECGIDIYNGVKEDKVGFYDIKTGVLTELAIPPASSYISDFDAR